MQKKLVAIFKDKQNLFFFYAVCVLDRPSKIKWTLGWVIYNFQVHLNPRWHLIIDRDACAAFWKLNKLNKDVFRGFLFGNLSNSLYL